jgi:hypothetical protein
MLIWENEGYYFHEPFIHTLNILSLREGSFGQKKKNKKTQDVTKCLK